MRKLSIVSAMFISAVVALYLYNHPGYLTRPQVGDDVAELEAWLHRNGYIKLEGRSAGPNLYEGTLEVINDPENLAKWKAREAAGTLLDVHRFYREQFLCPAGQYFVLWRPDQTEMNIAEIIYQDVFCHI